MDNPAVLKIMILLSISIGILCALIPNILSGKRKLTGMLLTAFFFLISIIMLGIFYVNNGIVSCTLLKLSFLNLKFHIEFLNIIFLGNLSLLWIITIHYTYYYLQNKKASESERCKILSFMALCIVAASLMALSANMITMFIFYEMLTLFTIPLVYSNDFSFLGKYLRPLIYSAALLWLPAILYLNFTQGSTEFIHNSSIKLTSNAGLILFLMCVFGIAKAGLVPVHTWLPFAMIATHPVSAMLHSVAVVNSGLFCIFKIIFYFFGFSYINQLIGNFNWLIIFPAITILYSGVRALMSDDIKQMLAYSTIGQLSTCLIGVFLLSKLGMVAAVIHMLSHSISKITLFFAVGAIYLQEQKSKISDLKGMYNKMPYTTIIYSIASLSLMGTPLLAGYISKSYLHHASYDQSLAYYTLICSTILTFLYQFKVLQKLFTKASRINRSLSENKTLLIPMVACTLLNITFPLIAFVAEKLLAFL